MSLNSKSVNRRELLKLLLNDPESIKEFEDDQAIIIELAKTNERFLVRLLRRAPHLIADYPATRDLGLLFKVVEDDFSDYYGRHRRGRPSVGMVAGFLPPEVAEAFLGRIVEKSPDMIYRIGASNISPHLLDIWVEAKQPQGPAPEVDIEGQHDHEQEQFMTSLMHMLTTSQLPQPTLAHLIRRFPEVVVRQAEQSMRAYDRVNLPEGAKEMWEAATGQTWVDPEPIEREAPQWQQQQRVRDRGPKEADRLPSRDMPKSKLLGGKGGYSVRGFKGTQFGRIPGQVLSDDGEPFVLSIGGLETDLVDELKQLPAEMYEIMDMHGLGHRADLKRFVGWIGGTYTKDAMYVSEAQSDLMQRTWQFQTEKAWVERAKQEFAKAMEDLTQFRQELHDLKKQYQEHGPLNQRYRYVELINQAEARYKDALQKAKNPPREGSYGGLRPQHAQYRSKIENLHKKWIEAFYHIAIWYAKHLKVNTLFIAKSKDVAGAWSRQAGESTTVYSRAYDGIAQKLGAKDTGRWWQMDVSNFTPREDIARIANLISEHIDSAVLLEGMTPRDIQAALERAGYVNVQIHKAPSEEDQEYHRVDLFGAQADGDQYYQLGHPKTDLTSDEIDQAAATVHMGEPRLLSPDEINGIEELEEDATLLITAAKQDPEGRWLGVSVVCLDDPRLQFDMPTYRAQEDEPDESYIDTMAADELEAMFQMPAWGEDPEAP